MNIERRRIKIYLKSLAPIEVYETLESYRIPSPYKEILITACIYNKEGFEGCDFMEEKFKIHIGYWSFVKKLKEALEKVQKTYEYKKNQK